MLDIKTCSGIFEFKDDIIKVPPYIKSDMFFKTLIFQEISNIEI